MFSLPDGAAGGILAGAMTMSAAISSAEEAVKQGVFKLAEAQTAERVSGMIALCLALPTSGARSASSSSASTCRAGGGSTPRRRRRSTRRKRACRTSTTSGSPATGRFALRAYRLTNNETAGKTVRQFLGKHPEYKVVNVARGERASARPTTWCCRRAT